MRQLVLIWFLYTIVIVDPYRGLCLTCINAYHYDLNVDESIEVYGPTDDDEKKGKEDNDDDGWVFCHFCLPPQYVPKYLD